MESARAPPDFKQVVETHKQETIAAGFSATIQSERGGYRPAKPRKLKALEEHFRTLEDLLDHELCQRARQHP